MRLLFPLVSFELYFHTDIINSDHLPEDSLKYQRCKTIFSDQSLMMRSSVMSAVDFMESIWPYRMAQQNLK